MRIKANARDHGITAEDILRAIDYAVIGWYLDGYALLVDPIATGRLLEIGINDTTGDVLHAADAREKFLPLKRGQNENRRRDAPRDSNRE